MWQASRSEALASLAGRTNASPLQNQHSLPDLLWDSGEMRSAELYALKSGLVDDGNEARPRCANHHSNFGWLEDPHSLYDNVTRS